MSDSSRESSPHSSSSVESCPPVVLPGFPLSLQDLCLLRVLLQVNEFPVEHLALLSRAIRQRLFNGLPHADILHLSDTALFSDLDEVEDRIGTARVEILNVIFYGESKRFISYNLHEGRHTLDVLDSKDPVDPVEFNRIVCKTKSFTSLKASLILQDDGDGLVIPKHLNRFAKIWDLRSSYHSHDLPPDQAWSLLHYCNMRFAPKELKIDCSAFTETALWRNCSTADPVIPVLQVFLSSVEELELGSIIEIPEYMYRGVGGGRVYETLRKLPYILLYNIATSDQPCLKHLKVFDIPAIAQRILESLSGLLCTRESNTSQVPSTSPKLKLSHWLLSQEPKTTIPLALSKPEPYKLESISILPYGQYRYQMNASTAQLIASLSQSIIAYQMQSLRNVTIRNIGFCTSLAGQTVAAQIVNVPEYMALLSLLSQLLKQPQFEALTIDKTPFSAACELIMSFLTTPTSHGQTLIIEAREEDEESTSIADIEDSDVNESRKRNDKLESSDIPPLKMMKHSPSTLVANSRSLPETNTQYKYLDLGQSCNGLLSTFPELKLKKLTILTQEMIFVSEDTIIQVEHITFTAPALIPMDTPAISSAHLEKFIISNLVVKRLEFTSPIALGLLPALNHCLSVLYQQGRGLEEIVLNSVQFNNCEHMKQFFIRVRDLSHDHGTTLVMSACHQLLVRFNTGIQEYTSGNEIMKFPQLSTQEDESRLFADLKSQFQEKKIKKIVFTAYKNNEGHLLLEPLTDKLVVHNTDLNPVFLRRVRV